jgi:hypothetical protein
MTRDDAVAYLVESLGAYALDYEADLIRKGMDPERAAAEVSEIQHLDYDALVSLGVTPEEIQEAQ